MRFEGLLKAGVGNTSWLCRHGPIVQKPGISGVRQHTVPRPNLLSSGAFQSNLLPDRSLSSIFNYLLGQALCSRSMALMRLHT